MERLIYLITIILLSMTVTEAKTPIEANNMDALLQSLVEQEQIKNNLVGLGAIAIHRDKIFGPVVSGERKHDSEVLLSTQDKWHIGSVTKSITSTMIARLVEQGKLKWTTTVSDIFPSNNDIHEQWKRVTLLDLLTHSSGAPANFSLSVNLKKPKAGEERVLARRLAVFDILKVQPEKNTSKEFHYSNVGYTIAGVMAESVMNRSWESLIEGEIFAPLNIESGGFGPPKDLKGTLEQPRGHKKMFGFTISADTDSDNSPIMGPAGTIHLSLSDLGIFVHEHLKGEYGFSSLLKHKNFKQLHTPRLNNYALGWVVSKPLNESSGPVIWHNGSNTMWYTMVAFLPKINAVIIVTSNDGNIKKAEASAWFMIKKITNVITNNAQSDNVSE
mgnify:CR=1 FL=1